MEPTPSTAGEPRYNDRTPASIPASVRVIVSYVDKEAGRVANETAARHSAAMLSEVAGVEIRHVRLMSGNAHVVEVVGLDGEHAGKTIESIVERLGNDPAVEYAERDAIMRIQ